MDRDEILYSLQQIPDVEIGDTTDNICVVFDNQTGKCFQYEFNVTEEILASKIKMSPAIPKQFNFAKQDLAKYLLSNVDKNAFLTLEEIWFVYNKADYEKMAAYYKSYDPYVFYESKEMGTMWFDHNVCIIDISNIYERVLSLETSNHMDKTRKEIIITAIHELRHLMLDTNIVLPSSVYPSVLAEEYRVEEYAQDVVDNNESWKLLFKN